MSKKNQIKIKFVGGKSGEAAPRFITDGKTRINLPASQKRAFSHPDAKRILAVAPELYKRVISK